MESLRQKMYTTTTTLPDDLVVMTMNGVVPTLGSQLMADIGNVTRFTHQSALTSFAGVNPEKNDCGQLVQKASVHSRKTRPTYKRPFFK